MLDKVIVPINIQSKLLEVKSVLEYCELALIFTDEANCHILKVFMDDCRYRTVIYNMDNESFEETGLNRKPVPITTSEFDDANEDNVALMLHTSGTTSSPKRVMLTHKNLISNVKSIIESLKLTENDRTLIALPMFLSSGNVSQFLTHLFLGASIVIMDGMFMPDKFYKLVREENITNFTGVPFMMSVLLNYKYRYLYDISTLRLICFGGAPTPAAKARQLIVAFPSVHFVHMYGQSEASTRITHLLPEDSIRKLGSAGKPIPDVQLRIVDKENNDLSPGETGEIIVAGENVMKGYYKRSEETNSALKDGWLHTGDLGWLDREGFVYISGRMKNVIIRAGLNLYPEEIEEFLKCHPAVKEALVTGRDDELLGEVPIAKVVLKEDICDIDANKLMKYCMEGLHTTRRLMKSQLYMSFKKPRRVKL